MEDYRIVTDSASDLPESYIKEHDISLAYLSTIIDGVTYNDKNPLNIEDFYEKVKNGAMPTTSQTNPEDCKEVLLKELEKTRNILVIAFSSGLSGTCQSFRIAADELMEEHKDVKIEVIDSLAASLGQGLLVHKAIVMKENGASFEEVCEWVEKNKLNLCHVFTVDDLFHLSRGGRISKATAVIGSMVSIKPILHVDNEGHLINLDKKRGRKKSLLTLVDMMEERVGSFKDKNDIIFISHSNCKEDAEFVASTIEERFGYKTFLIDYIGTVIGSHTGIGTVALFFMGDYR